MNFMRKTFRAESLVRSTRMIFLLGFLVGGFSGMKAEASTVTWNGDYAFSFSASTDKNAYNPGDPISITGSITAPSPVACLTLRWGLPTPCAYIDFLLPSQTASIVMNNKLVPFAWSTTLTAPSTSGSYTININHAVSGMFGDRWYYNTPPAGLPIVVNPVLVPVNGACSATHYACTAGTSANNVSGATSYTWNCNGANGGTNASCSEAKLLGTISVSSNIAASWTITGPATISGSGTTQTSLNQPIGTYTITWGAVSGYTTPASSSLTLVNGGTIGFSGMYVSSAVCTGTLPANATTYAGDDTGLSANTARTYAASNTGAKCEYACNNGYGWNGSSCTVLTPVITFTGSPTSLAAGGGSVTLNWSITNGAGGGSCTGYSTTNLSGWSTAGTGGKSVTGTNIPITVPSTTIFDLDCWNGIGTAAVRKSVTVTVAAANQVPIAAISAPAVNQSITQGQSITFTGSGTDTDGSISAYRWMDGNCTTGTLLNSTSSFGTSTLSLGAHTVYFSVQDNSGAWSTNCPSRTITVNAACVPTYSYTCVQTGGSCTTATCGQTLATTPDCVKLTTDCGGSQTSVLPSECVSNGVSCSNGSVTCPACPQSNTGNWREVTPGQ